MRHIASLLLVFALARPAVAAEVMVFETSGPNGKKATETILEALRSELESADVTLQRRPPGLKTASVKAAKKISKPVAAGDAAIGVATSIVKKRRKISLVIVVVNAGGAVIFDKVVKLPKKRPEKKIKGVMKNAARAIEEDLRSAPAPEREPEPAPTPEPDTIAATPIDPSPADPGPGFDDSTVTPPSIPLVAARDDEPVATVSSRHRRSKDGFHAAVRGGAGGLFFQDDIQTTVQGGELEIAVGMTFVTLAGLDLAYDDWLTFTGSFRYYGATIVHGYEGDNADTPSTEEPLVNPQEIGCTGMGISALLGTGMKMGPLIGGLVAGINYDSFAADPQRLTTSLIDNEVAVLVPSWTRLATAAGVTLSYGNLASQGLTGQLGGLIIPWAAHQETPRTSGASSSVLGGQGWLRARYSLPDLFGSGGGMFADVRVDFEYLKIQYSGNGTRQVLGGTAPVQASKESRLAIGGGLSVGYVY